MYSTAQKYLYKISKINRQKVLWYKLSLIVVLGIGFFVYGYDYIIKEHLEKYFLFAGIIISAIWWYWTMGVLSTLLDTKELQMRLLEQIIEGIKEVKIKIKDH